MYYTVTGNYELPGNAACEIAGHHLEGVCGSQLQLYELKLGPVP